MKGLNKYKGLLYLGLLVIVAPLLAYRYAVSETVSQWVKTGRIRQQSEQLMQVERIAPTQAVGIDSDDTEVIRSGLLVAGLLPVIESEKLILEHFSPLLTSAHNGITLTTGQLSVQGRFSGLVRLIDKIEKDIPACKIISARFRTAKPRNRGNTKTLSCTIYVQQIVFDN